MLYIENILAGLRELADRSYQQRVWTGRGLPDEMSSFGEVVCDMFDGTGLSGALSSGALADEVGAEATVVLQRLDAAVDAVDGSQSVEELISSPAMEEVRDLAKRALDLIQPGAPAPDEA